MQCRSDRVVSICLSVSCDDGGDTVDVDDGDVDVDDGGDTVDVGKEAWKAGRSEVVGFHHHRCGAAL